MNFGAARGLTRRVAVSGEFKVLVLDLWDVTFIDTSASLAIEDVMVNATELGLEALLVGRRPRVHNTLERLGVTERIPAEHCLETRAEALTYAAELLAKRG